MIRKRTREAGVSYQCHLSGGKHSCIEKDIEIIPLRKIVTVLAKDTFGISMGLTPWLAQPVKTLFAVRCKTLDRQDYGTAF